ncbi:MAG: reverse gyrase [Sulfolobales archaeon]
MIKAVYKSLCPNCDTENISSERLSKGLACERCMPEPDHLVVEGYMSRVRDIEKELEEINKIFIKYVKAPMWGLQRLWTRRFLNNESFSMIAPTGSGKTTTQIILSVYAVKKYGKRILILLPTSLLAHQVYQKLIELINLLGINDISVVAYHSLLKESERKESLSKINSANIIVTTTMSLIKKSEINSQRIDIAFIDDVDSFLKRSKSIDYVLSMLGVDKELRDKVEELINYEKSIRKLIKSEPDKYEEEMKKIINEKSEIRKKVSSQIIVSGATQTTIKTKRIMILETLFGFTLGRRIEVGRRVIDTFIDQVPKESQEDLVAELIKKLGSGGILFIPLDKGSEYVSYLENRLREKGLNVEGFRRTDKKIFERFVSGEVDVLIGLATTKSPLTRGIDLPERVRYVIFFGVPKFRINIDVNEFHPTKWLMLINSIRDAIPREYQDEIDYIIGSLSNLKFLKKEDLAKIREAIRTNTTLEGFLEYARRIADRTLRFLQKILSDKDIVEAMKKSPYISMSSEEGKFSFVIPDVAAYLQGSGRSSRLYAGGVTLGLSVLIIDDQKAFNSLVREMKWYTDEVSWKRFSELDLETVLSEIDKDRERVKAIKSGKLVGEAKDLVKTKLLIVESPNKARTIARIFGRPAARVIQDLQTYETVIEDSLLIVAASGGHIVDLSQGDGLFGVLIEHVKDKKHNIYVPVYVSLKRCANCGRTVPEEVDKCPYCGSRVFRSVKNVINALRLLASQVDEVLIGTDPDSEGEKIAWDLYLLLRPFNKNIKRIKFHEVTKRAILEALRNPSSIDENMVKAQIVRRIEDRWIGYSLSPILWKEFGLNYLSAGRVQTPVLGFVVERTKEATKKIELIEIETEDGNRFIIKAPRGTYKKILDKNYVEIKDLEIKEEVVNPPPPFTTDTMLVAITSSLRISAEKAMDIAQKLFELGLITYHRTDSTTVSTFGLGIARDYISNSFGEEYFTPRKWEMPGAHECIRPTRAVDTHRLKTLVAAGILKLQQPLTDEDLKVYDIIFRRFIASQMPPAKIKRVEFTLVAGDFEQRFSFIKEILEPGFTLVTPVPIEKREFREGKLSIKSLRYRLISEKPLYGYSDLVALMKEKEIGRPSTYAVIIETLRRRGYVVELKKAGSKLVSTKLGEKVYSYLISNYEPYVNINRTRELEKKTDLIERGEADYNGVLDELYDEIRKILVDAIRNKHVKYPVLDTKYLHM